ncbi:hypothetical protein [Phenylobacterium sp.]|uniref:hypothetical protein n=1 Tax=Phenylobacterium sp. TaxID=1871053 RepID=UPI00260B36B2|nr:hypothetical protein [Phenylobacterium sp.]
MTATHYQSSKGPLEIASMPGPYLANALAKLERENDPARADELAAMRDRMAALDAEREEENPRVHLGANNPPEETPPATVAPTAEGFEAIKVNIEDLLVEARNWADGVAVENQAQADEIARLIEDLRDAEGAADEARKAEVKPLDDARDAIQTRYNLYIAPLKNKKPGKVPLAVSALKTTLDAWLIKLDDERRERAAVAKAKADKLAEEAAAAMRASVPEDFGAREAAEEKVAEAQAAATVAKQISTARVHAHGGNRAIGLRTHWVPALATPKDALIHYLNTRPDDIKAFLLELAVKDVAEGKRAIPGFTITEERKVA